MYIEDDPLQYVQGLAKNAGITLKQLLQEAGFHQTVVYKWKNYKTSPRISTILHIKRAAEKHGQVPKALPE